MHDDRLVSRYPCLHDHSGGLLRAMGPPAPVRDRDGLYGWVDRPSSVTGDGGQREDDHPSIRLPSSWPAERGGHTPVGDPVTGAEGPSW